MGHTHTSYKCNCHSSLFVFNSLYVHLSCARCLRYIKYSYPGIFIITPFWDDMIACSGYLWYGMDENLPTRVMNWVFILAETQKGVGSKQPCLSCAAEYVGKPAMLFFVLISPWGWSLSAFIREELYCEMPHPPS